jgi:hypothetical protein
MFAKDILVAQVNSVIKLGEPKTDLDNFWAIAVAQALVLLSSEYSLDALIYHLWANVVEVVVKTWIEVWVLLRQDQY